MTLTLGMMLLLAAAPDAPLRVAVPELRVVNVDPKLGAFYAEHLAQELAHFGLQAQSPRDIAAVLGLERQKQLLGCADELCTTSKLGAALEVDGIVVGSVTRLDKNYVLDVRVVSSGDARVLATANATTDDNDRLVGTLVVVAEQLARQTAAKLGRTLPDSSAVEVVRGPSRVRRSSWIPAAVGVAAVAAGTVMLVQARSTYDRLTIPQAALLTQAEAQALGQQGSTYQTVGWVGVGVGAAALAAGAAMLIFGGTEVVRAGVALGPDGAGVTLAGEF